MIVVDASSASRVPVLGYREPRVRLAVGQRVIQVGGVADGVGGHGVVDKALGRWRDDHLEDCPAGYRSSVLVEDSPLLFVGAFVPNTDVVIVGSIPGVSPIRARRDKHDGVRIAVNARVVDVGVVSTTVLVRGMVDEGRLVGGLVEVD